jgi:hypothetical protein
MIEMAPSIRNFDIPPVLSPGNKQSIPWMQLGESDLEKNFTPPPATVSDGRTSKQIASARFSVNGNAIRMSNHHRYTPAWLTKLIYLDISYWRGRNAGN